MIIMKRMKFILLLCLHYEYIGAFAKGETKFEVANTEKGLMMPGSNRKDQQLFQNEDFNALEKITPAPLAVALLAQIVLVSAQYKTDFGLECPRTGCKYMEYPRSFKASLLQMSFSAYNAFNKAHVNMDEIQMLTRMMPTEVRNAVMTLVQGDDVEIELLLPEQFNSIKRIAGNARLLANETVAHFEEVQFILEEIIAGGTTTRTLSSQEVDKLEVRIQNEKAWEEQYKTQKQELEENKKEIKKHLEKSRADFDKALEDLPSGWDIIGMNLVESLAKSTAGLIDGLTTVLTVGLSNINRLGDQVIDGFGGSSEPDVANSGNSAKTEEIKRFLDLPKCNEKEKPNDNTTDIYVTPKMQKVDAQRTATEFITALTDLIRVESILQAFYANIFVMTKENEIGLKTHGEEDVNFLKKSISNQKTAIDSNSNIPEFLKKGLVLFYKNIYDLADKIKSGLETNISKEDITKLKKETKELTDVSRCFNTWAKGALKIPAMDTPFPFPANNSAPSSPQLASQIATENAQIKVEMYQKQLENAQKQHEYNSAQLLVTNNKLREAINKLNEFNGAQATLVEIISILQEALETLNQLRAKWLEILEFFQKLESVIDKSLGMSLDNFGTYVETGRQIKQRSGKLSNNFKNQLYGYIQEAMTNGYLVNSMSSVYVNISAKYIMPPVRSLGIMMETKDLQKITSLKNKITNQAKTANGEISRRIAEEKMIFDAAVKRRRNEIHAAFKPILDHIPQARKEELTSLVGTATNVIPKVTTTKDAMSWV